MHSFTQKFTIINPPFGDPDELMQEYPEIADRLEAAQSSLKQGLMAALAGGDAP